MKKTVLSISFFLVGVIAMAQGIYFDDFSGATDNAKAAAMETYLKTKTGPTPKIILADRSYNFSVQIPLYSGMKLEGTGGQPAREYGRGTKVTYSGAAGTSLFRFLDVAGGETQPSQSYPADESPRDISMIGIEFDGGSGVDFLTKYDINNVSPAGKTLWYCLFRDCGWKGWRTVWNGWGTGTVFGSGVSHMQGYAQTPLWVGGSECTLFPSDFCFMDSQDAGFIASGTSSIRSKLEKSRIGPVMITCRQNCYALRIEYANNLVVDGLAADAQDSDPAYGYAFKIESLAKAVTITNCSIKGYMANPSLATGGAAANQAWVQINGGQQIKFIGNNFQRAGTSQASETTPLVYVAAAVGTAQVTWMANSYNGWTGNDVVLQQASPNRILFFNDPNVFIIPANTDPETPITLVDGPIVTADLAVSYNPEVTIAGNRTMIFNNGKPGKYYQLSVTQGGTGSYSITWPASVIWKRGTPPVLTTAVGSTFSVMFYYNGANFIGVY